MPKRPNSFRDYTRLCDSFRCFDITHEDSCIKRRFSYPRFMCDVLKVTGKDVTALDLTYGRGAFYTKCRPRTLIGIDIARHEHKTEPDVFVLGDLRSPPIVPRHVDIVVFDPPFAWWRRGHEAKGREEFNMKGIDMVAYLSELLGAYNSLLKRLRPRYTALRAPVPVEVDGYRRVLCEYTTNKHFIGLFPSRRLKEVQERVISVSCLMEVE